MLQVRLLGAVAAERDGEQVPLPPPASRLLAVLALRPGPQDRETVAATLWPGAAGPAGRANLRTAVWALRGPSATARHHVPGPRSGYAPKRSVDSTWPTASAAPPCRRRRRGRLAAMASCCPGAPRTGPRRPGGGGGRSGRDAGARAAAADGDGAR
jgi:hypothetical protein